MFMSSTFEHQDSIISVARHPTKNDTFLSAAKDGYIIVWKLEVPELAAGESENSDKDDMFKFVEDCDFNQPLTKAKWLTDQCIIASTTTGRLLVFTTENSANTYKKREIYQTDSAIWDLCVHKGQKSTDIFVALDSGNIVSLNSDTLKPTQVFSTVNQSVLCMSLDPIGDSLVLSVGTNSSVVLLKAKDGEFEEIHTIKGTSDNVSSIKTVGDKTMTTVYGTFNGRVAFFQSEL